MATKRLIDANAYPCRNCEVSYCYKNCKNFNSWFNKTVDAVEVVHGRWDKYAKYTICSECDIGFCYYKNETDRFRYCPNCGAKMDGDGNG